MFLFLASSQHSFLPTFIKTSKPGFQYSDMLMPPKKIQISRQEMELKKKKQTKKKTWDKVVAFQEAAVFDYKGISNPVSLSRFLNISV